MRWLADHGIFYADLDRVPLGVLEDARQLMQAEAAAVKIANARRGG
jgi:hypothetical protein